MKTYFSILSCLEPILKGFSSPVLLMSCPQGPFGSWKFDFFNFSSPLSGCRARRGLLGAGNLTFSIFQALCPVVVPAGAFWELEIWLFEFFKPLFTLIHPYFPLFPLICPYLPLFTLNYPSQGPNLPLFTPIYPGAAALFTLIYPYAGALFTLIYPYAGALFTLIYP